MTPVAVKGQQRQLEGTGHSQGWRGGGDDEDGGDDEGGAGGWR